MTDQPLIPAAREVLEPFATAVDDADESSIPDRADLWEGPMAMCVTYGDMRAARDLLARLNALDADALAQEIGREAVATKSFPTRGALDTATWNAVYAARLTLARLGIGEQPLRVSE